MELADPAEVQNPKSEVQGERPGAPSTLDVGLRTLDSAAYVPHTLRADLQSHGRLSAVRVLELSLALTEALAHLHEHGLVHRDIKPSNIIFVNNRPKLADIGLVTDAGDARSIVGTEGYLAPEGPGTPQADVYALGKVLYEAVTGLDRREFPRLPSELRAWPDAALVFEVNEILLKACAVSPCARYANAEAILVEIEFLKRGQSVKRQRTLERCVRVLKRAALIALLFAAIVGGTRIASNSLHPAAYVPKLSSKDEATDLYNMGRHAYQKNTGPALRQAIDYFQKAVEKDSHFALAYAALASCYCWGLGDFDADYLKARQLAERALALDDKLAEAHKVMGWVRHLVDWDWSGSEKEFKRALELAPHDPTVHEWYGNFLTDMGRFDDSIRELQEAAKLDGLSQSIRVVLGISYLSAHKDELAISELQKVIGLETNAPSTAYLKLADLYEWRGEFLKAIELRERWSRLADREDADSVSRRFEELRAAYDKEGRAGYWQKRLDWAKRENQDYLLPGLYAQLGDATSAFAALQDEFESHSVEPHASYLAGILGNRELDGLRPDPRFARFLREMKLK